MILLCSSSIFFSVSQGSDQETFDHNCAALGWDFLVLLTQNISPGVRYLTKIFSKMSNPRPVPCLPPPRPRRLNIDRCIKPKVLVNINSAVGQSKENLLHRVLINNWVIMKYRISQWEKQDIFKSEHQMITNVRKLS